MTATAPAPGGRSVGGSGSRTAGGSVGAGELGGDPRLARLWAAAYRRLEATGGSMDTVALIRAPTDEERAAVDRLLGVRSRGRDIRVRLTDLDTVLRQRAGSSLRTVVESVVGPVRDRPGERKRARAQESELWTDLGRHPALAHHPALGPWIERIRTTGQWRRLDDSGRQLGQALDVLVRLPLGELGELGDLGGRTARSRLAADVLGHAHALDDGAPVGRLVLGALASMAGVRGALTAADRRRLWSDAGVVADETSSTVLTLGLRPGACGPVTEAAARWADSDVPLPVPLVAIQAETWRVAAGTCVWVCENPAVLSAASGLGQTVVCVEGRPSVAGAILLRGLAAGGAMLAYHGDFGSGGIAIANDIIGGVGAVPWRMSVADHAFALDRAQRGGTSLRPLRGAVPEACWDAALAPAIQASGVEVEEELVLDVLLDDLASASRGPLS